MHALPWHLLRLATPGSGPRSVAIRGLEPAMYFTKSTKVKVQNDPCITCAFCAMFFWNVLIITSHFLLFHFYPEYIQIARLVLTHIHHTAAHILCLTLFPSIYRMIRITWHWNARPLAKNLTNDQSLEYIHLVHPNAIFKEYKYPSPSIEGSTWLFCAQCGALRVLLTVV